MRKTLISLLVIGLIALLFNAHSARASDEMLKDLEERLSRCATYEDYEQYASSLQEQVSKAPEGKEAGLLYYMLARARTEELAFLADKNDIDSTRLYMQVSDRYFEDALSYLDRASQVTQSKKLIDDINFTKFVIFKNKFQPEKADALLSEIANSIANYSGDQSANKAELDRIAGKFDGEKLPEYALKLKTVYVSKVSPEAAKEVAEDIKKEADSAFEQGDSKKADKLYQYYINIGRAVLDKNQMALKTVSIADEYFNKERYAEAFRYYSDYLREYPDSEGVDYCIYKIGICLHLTKNYEEAIAHFESFLDKYPDSKWFDAGFEDLCKLYYEEPTRERGIEGLERLIKKFKTREICDYAELLKGLLYYGGEDYVNAMKSFVTIQKDYPATKYWYTTEILINDIKEINKGNPPSFSIASENTYKTWQPFIPINAKIKPTVSDDEKADSRTGIRTIREALGFSSTAYAADKSFSVARLEGLTDENAAEIVLLEGDVNTLEKDGREWQGAKEGEVLKKGDRIKTAASSSCDIALDAETKNVVGIRENSDVILTLDKNQKLEIVEAHIFARLSSIPAGSSFEVKTPLAVCGARGTGLGIKSTTEGTEATAYNDNIFVKDSTGGEKTVEEGFCRTVDTSGQIAEAQKADPERIAEFERWPVYITVKPSAKINLSIEKPRDLDKFDEFLYDKTDASRLPKKMEEGTEEDLLSVSWGDAGAGKFLDDKQTLSRTWQAPDTPGIYKVSVSVGDLGLIRPPDEGKRKEKIPQKLTVIVIVKD